MLLINTYRLGIFTALSILLIPSLCFSEATLEKLVAAHSDENDIVTPNLVPPSDNKTLKQLLVGKWQQVSWFHPQKQAQEDYPDNSNVYKLYTSNNEFFFFDYGTNGELYKSYGGTYEIIGPNKVRETISFYAPYRHTTGRPENGQLVLYTGKTMVNASIVQNIEIDQKKNRLILSGVLKQNTKNVEEPDRYGDRHMNNGYIKLYN